MGNSVSKSKKFERFLNRVVFPLTACSLLALSYTNCSGGFDALETKLASQLSGPPVEQPPVEQPPVEQPEPADILAPVIEVKNKPDAKIREKSTTVEFEVTDDKSLAAEISVLCAIDTSEFSNCNSPIQLANLSVGSHFIKIKARDKAGNASDETAIEFQVLSDLPAVPRIMMLGDSITEGGNATRVRMGQLMEADGQQYLYVGSMGGNGIRHEGHSGWTTGNVAGNNIDRWARDYRPDVVMLHLGTNDLGQHRPTSESMANINSIISTIFQYSPNAIVFVAKILPMFNEFGGVNIDNYNAALVNTLNSRITAGQKIVIVDMNTGFTNSDLPDNVHPSQSGYTKMGERWYQYFKQIYK